MPCVRSRTSSCETIIFHADSGSYWIEHLVEVEGLHIAIAFEGLWSILSATPSATFWNRVLTDPSMVWLALYAISPTTAIGTKPNRIKNAASLAVMLH